MGKQLAELPSTFVSSPCAPWLPKHPDLLDLRVAGWRKSWEWEGRQALGWEDDRRLEGWEDQKSSGVSKSGKDGKLRNGGRGRSSRDNKGSGRGTQPSTSPSSRQSKYRCGNGLQWPQQCLEGGFVCLQVLQPLYHWQHHDHQVCRLRFLLPLPQQ